MRGCPGWRRASSVRPGDGTVPLPRDGALLRAPRRARAFGRPVSDLSGEGVLRGRGERLAPDTRSCRVCDGVGGHVHMVPVATFMEALESRELFPTALLRDPRWCWYCAYCDGRDSIPEVEPRLNSSGFTYPAVYSRLCPSCGGSRKLLPETLDEFLSWVTLGEALLAAAGELLRGLPHAETVVWCPESAPIVGFNFPDPQTPHGAELLRMGFRKGLVSESLDRLFVGVPPLRAFPWTLTSNVPSR